MVHYLHHKKVPRTFKSNPSFCFYFICLVTCAQQMVATPSESSETGLFFGWQVKFFNDLCQFLCAVGIKVLLQARAGNIWETSGSDHANATGPYFHMGFHSHGGFPIAGWFLLGKILLKFGFRGTPISGNLHMWDINGYHGYVMGYNQHLTLKWDIMGMWYSS